MGEFLRLGIRIYVDTVGTDTFAKHGVFYSRRENGHSYRWHYEAEGDRWCGAPVHPEATPNSFRVAQRRRPRYGRACSSTMRIREASALSRRIAYSLRNEDAESLSSERQRPRV